MNEIGQNEMKLYEIETNFFQLVILTYLIVEQPVIFAIFDIFDILI